MIHRRRHLHALSPVLLSLLISLWSVPPLLALPITDQFSLSGLVNNVRSFALGDLQAFTPVTQNVTYQSGSGTVSSSFTGVPLYDVLTSPQGGGGIVQSSGVKNDFLRDYVVATGSNGYRAVYSVKTSSD